MILAINTATPQFSLSLTDSAGSLIASFTGKEEKGRFSRLLPAMDFLFTTSGFKKSDLTCIAIARGPGSFTGLRIGLSLAKGLSHALEIPIFGVSTLEALACQIFHARIPVVPVLRWRRGVVFTALFQWDAEDHLLRKGKDMPLCYDDFPHVFKDRALFLGDDFGTQAPAIQGLLGSRALLAPPHLWHVQASGVAAAALDRIRTRQMDDTRALLPIYLGPPDIRPNPFPRSPLGTDKETGKTESLNA